MDLYVDLSGDHVRLPNSIGAPAGSVLQGAVPATALRDADPGAAPPEIRTLSGETLFVRADQREELTRFCLTNGIPQRRRLDVWGNLLEPFLDTEFTPEQQAATLLRLSRIGLDADEVAGIQARVGPVMLAYNSRHWEWCYLGLADLLDAATADWIPEHERVALGDWSAFYAWAMTIADLGPLLT